MKTKLTLVLDDEIIAAAKQYAKESGSSLSEIVSNYFKAIARPSNEEKKNVSDTPITDSLTGILKMPENFDGDYDKLLKNARDEHFKKKYNLD
jgi:hypothetical protein